MFDIAEKFVTQGKSHGQNGLYSQVATFALLTIGITPNESIFQLLLIQIRYQESKIFHIAVASSISLSFNKYLTTTGD